MQGDAVAINAMGVGTSRMYRAGPNLGFGGCPFEEIQYRCQWFEPGCASGYQREVLACPSFSRFGTDSCPLEGS